MGSTQHLPADPCSWESTSKVSGYREILPSSYAFWFIPTFHHQTLITALLVHVINVKFVSLRSFSSASCHVMSFFLLALTVVLSFSRSGSSIWIPARPDSSVPLPPADELAGDLPATREHCSSLSFRNNLRGFHWPWRCKLAPSSATEPLSNRIIVEVHQERQPTPCKSSNCHTGVPDIFISWRVTDRPEHLLNTYPVIYCCSCLNALTSKGNLLNWESKGDRLQHTLSHFSWPSNTITVYM